MLDHVDYGSIVIGVDGHVGRAGTAVGIAAAVDVPGQTYLFLDGVGRLHAGHFMDCGFGDVSFTIEFATVEEHLAEPGDVVCGRKQSSGGHGLSLGIVQRILQELDLRFFEFLGFCCGLVVFGETCQLFRVRPERRIDHPERIE